MSVTDAATWRALWHWLGGEDAAAVQLTVVDVPTLNARLDALGEVDQGRVRDEFQLALNEADQLEIWELNSLLAGQPCGDDSFAAFRRWLVLQGRATYMTTLAVPDSMAEVPGAPAFGLDAIYVEDAGSVENTPGEPARVAQQRSWHWTDSSPEQISRRLPRLWRRLGGSFSWMVRSAAPAGQLTVEGLGTLAVGDAVVHKYGLGRATIKEILVAESAACRLQFASGERPFRLTSQFFELPPR